MSKDRRTRLFTGFLLIVVSVALLITFNIYIEKEVKKSEELIALNIEKIMNEYPAASGEDEEVIYESEDEEKIELE